MAGTWKQLVWFESLLLLGAAAGCTELDSYNGDYQGTVVGAEGDSFIRRGFPAGAVLELRDFRPPPTSGAVGRIVVRHLEPPTRLEADLQVIAPLEHDQLGQYDFPGGGRIRSFVFSVAVDATTSDPRFVGREPMAFVSLMDDDDVEVRIVSGPGDEPGDLFGLFILGKQ